jgi:hypothetical protein
MKPIQELKSAVISKEEVRGAIQSEFEAFLEKRAGSEGKAVESYIRNLAESELNQLYNELAANKGWKQRRGLIKKTKKKGGKVELLYQFSSSVKRSLAKDLHIKGKIQTEADEDDIAITLTPEGEEKATLNHYPYFALTPNEQTLAKQDTETWRKFKLVIKSLVSDNSIKATIGEVMEEMGVGAFVESGGSYNDIVGILGELQGLVIIRCLIPNGVTYQSRFLGHELNKKGQKIGIDLALENIGFQVKNYSLI